MTTWRAHASISIWSPISQKLGMKIVAGQQSYSARANWKLLVENSYDGYHGLPTHQRYFSFLE